MPVRASLSPEPLPATSEPISNEPGPRALALKKVYASALQSTLKVNSYQSFASCFPTPAKYCPSALEGVWLQLNARLEAECLKDFEKILEERKVVAGLNALDELLVQARQRRDRGIEGQEPLAPHKLAADQLRDIRMHGFLVKSQEELETKLRTVQDDNQTTVRLVMAQREEIQSLMANLESLFADVDGAVQALADVDGQSLKNEVWAVEQQMRDAS